MKTGRHLCHTMGMVTLSLALMVGATAIPQPSQANETLAEAERLDQKAVSMIKRAQLLLRIDVLEQEETDKICDFALEYEKAEWIKTRVYKTPFHDDIALTLEHISSLYKLCHAPMAQKYLNSVLRIKQKLYSTDSEAAASAHDALGDYLRVYMMEFKKAIIHYEEAKRIRIKLYGADDPRITKNFNRLAITVFYHKNEKTYAEKLLEDAIAITRASPENEANPYWRAHMDAGRYYAMTQAYEKAISHLETALNIVKDGWNNDEITILSELGMIYLNKNDLNLSLKYTKKAYDKAKALYKKTRTLDFLQTIELLSEIYTAMGDTKRSEQLKTELNQVKVRLIKE
ncbi:MAG: tetratricopeptide repeat protein [Proteobacteria bacterium]|nr:tetratricopeptide repeat protein [Pseudomonadota bacterium]MBU1584883.1 tetratricopeptide repeat protein [Pseudomonadota bacterium]MBU2456158.1 tetratricopeptide repeat protein [Pseudomonadota bacterium]MBU2627206.1 tetratricopeptide repeat protein [Pseudomonadota bacterium]